MEEILPHKKAAPTWPARRDFDTALAKPHRERSTNRSADGHRAHASSAGADTTPWSPDQNRV
jgi:hypothetical protein